MDNQERKVLIDAIVHYGMESRRTLAIEEMSELIKEICKDSRGMTHLEHIAEEIADVEIMMEQLKIMYSLWDHVGEFRKEKIERLEYRIKNNEK